MNPNYYPFINLPLPYTYNALEPFIDEKTMELHHDRHLQKYIDVLNAALEEHPRLQNMSLEQLIQNAQSLTQPLASVIGNNAGGVYNHRFFFNGLTPDAGRQPIGNLANAINHQYDNFDNFFNMLKTAALSVFGSGYAWLVLDRDVLHIITTLNQGSPIERNLCPILAIDVWEHAYYLKHYNLRADYIDDLFKVIDWEKAEDNYIDCLSRI